MMEMDYQAYFEGALRDLKEEGNYRVFAEVAAPLDENHYDVTLTREEKRRIKCWIDLNCPLWPDYTERPLRSPAVAKSLQ